jgi:integrase/recombinase XerD
MRGSEVAEEVLPPNLMRRGDIYYVRLSINGRDKWRSTGHTTLKSAIRKADEIKVRLRNQEDFGRATVPTFEEFVRQTYLPVYSVKKLAPGRDEEILAHALPFFGRRRLDEITKSLCVRFLGERLKKAARSTVNRERGTIQAIFQRAVEDGLIDSNPWQGIEREQEEPRIRVLTLENESKLREKLSPRYQRWLTFMLGTGLRAKEASAIRMRHVDFQKELIHVPASAAKMRKGRSVPLFPSVAEAILTEDKESGRLWPVNTQEFRDRLERASKAARIPHLSPHDLRHTFATRYLQGGGDIYVLSKILGHSSVKMTEANYAHLVKEDLVERSRHVQLRMATGSSGSAARAA